MTLRAVVLCLVCATPVPAAAQLITIRTLPVNQSSQFNFFPSQNLGMGGVSLALNDTVLDPFSNPAKGARVRFSQLMGSPATYSVTSEAGAGKTLPLGAVTRFGSWYSSGWLALQEVESASSLNLVAQPLPFTGTNIVDPEGLVSDLGATSHNNHYAFFSLGRAGSARGLSLGGSVMWSRLRAVDGVDLLYSGAAGVRQDGQSLDLRLGMLREWENGRSLEGVVLFDRYDMTHDVMFLDRFWEPGQQAVALRPRVEQNLDRTYTWGAHVGFVQPLKTPGLRIGGMATMNHMTHPKIPNYSIMNIPRDPGNSNAFNLGVGLSRTRGPTTWGIDVIYEPIWSHTWADAATPVQTVAGDTIPQGGMTIENHFRFSNAVLRLGVATDFGTDPLEASSGLQFGLVVRSISYRLQQFDHVQGQGRTQDESWLEWTPTWGVAIRLSGLELRYQGEAIHGTGRPGVRSSGGPDDLAAPREGGGIIVAPSGPLTLTEVRVTSHRISIAVPLR